MLSQMLVILALFPSGGNEGYRICLLGVQDQRDGFGELGLLFPRGSQRRGIWCIVIVEASLVAQTTVKNSPTMQETEFNSWVGKISWRRKWHPAPVFLPGKSHGQRSMEGYSPWGHKESDVTEATSTRTLLRCLKFSSYAFGLL